GQAGGWRGLRAGRDQIFRALRGPDGERLVLDENFFVETVLPKSVIRPLGKTEMDAYRKPFLQRDARLPTLVWPRELPIEGEPADVVAAGEQHGDSLAHAPVAQLP